MKQSYTVILDWMLDLGLTSSELLAYATIYGFCMDGESAYTGSRSYLARKMAAGSKRTVDNALQGLQEKGLIGKAEKTINGVKFCEYGIVWEQVRTVCKDCTTGANSAPAPGANSAPKNKEEKIKISPSCIARDMGICWDSEDTWEMLETLAKEPKWRKKTENALRLSLKKLANVPEVEAAEMMRKAIANGWQGIFDLHPDERARLYTQNGPYYNFPGAGGATAHPAQGQPRRGGVTASEEIVRAAMEQFNS